MSFVSERKKLLRFLVGALLFIGSICFWSVASPVAASSAQQQENQTVWDVITSNDQLNDFETLAQAAGLANNLDQDGPFTVFAPTDATLDFLASATADSDASVTNILLYHIVNGRYGASAVAGRDNLPTLMGEQINIHVQGGNIMLNDDVMITTADINASNGVVHMIDAVLLPPENALATSDKGSTSDSLLQVLQDDGRFDTFLAWAEDAGRIDELADTSQTYTVFAPTDAAFDKLEDEEVADLTRTDGTLRTIISYHMVGDELGINQIATDDLIPTLEGRPLFVTYDHGQVRINGQPLADFNVVASNGVIHAVNTVLTP